MFHYFYFLLDARYYRFQIKVRKGSNGIYPKKSLDAQKINRKSNVRTINDCQMQSVWPFEVDVRGSSGKECAAYKPSACVARPFPDMAEPACSLHCSSCPILVICVDFIFLLLFRDRDFGGLTLL